MRHWITSFLLLTTEACYGDSLILKAGFFPAAAKTFGVFRVLGGIRPQAARG